MSTPVTELTSADFSSIIKMVLAIPGGAAVIYMMVRAAINHYFKKNSEIEELKAQLRNKELESVKEKMRALEYTIEANIKKTEQLQYAQNNTYLRINTTAVNLHEVVNKFEENQKDYSETLGNYSKLTFERLDLLENFNEELKQKLKMASSRSEQVPIGKDSFVIKSKKE